MMTTPENLKEELERRVADLDRWEKEGTLEQHTTPWHIVKEHVVRGHIQNRPKIFDPFEENGIQPY